MLKVGGKFNSENYLKTLVIKVGKTSFSKFEGNKKVLYKAKFMFFAPP
jgi:hypothetical protein